MWTNGPRNVRRISVNVHSNLQCNCLSSMTTLKGIKLCFYYSKRERNMCIAFKELQMLCKCLATVN